MGRIGITDTSLRDGHQSLWATRMATKEMLPILEKIDEVGYHSLEVWGGATFDVCIRYLNEDPWERLRLIRERVKKTKLQMLVRGQSLVGYAHYPDDAVEKFIEKSAEYGIDIFRVFDALNDIRNLETSIKAVKKTGKHAQACISFTVSPVHSIEHYIKTALDLKDLGADSICIKDMAGLLSPYVSYELVKSLKEKVGLPVQLHTHYIGGLAVVSCLKAAEAGVDVIDTASVPMAFGSSQPPVETVVRALQGSEWDTGLKLHQLFAIADYFEKLRIDKGFERAVTKINDMKVFEHQVPGGMISNLISQLEEQKASDRLDEVLEEIPRVRQELGYPPLVTPTSQIVGIQAVFNVLTGERYKLCPGEVKDYVRGLYGKPPAPIDPEVKQKVIGDEEIISVRPADLLEPIWEKAKKEIAEITDREEDILTYILFPQVALKFFKQRAENGNNDADETIVPEQMAGELQTEKHREAVKASPRKKKSVAKGDAEMNFEEIKELILLLDQTSVADLEIKQEGYKLSLSKSVSAEKYEPSKKEKVETIKPPVVTEKPAVVEEDLIEVVAPMVGTFYAAPSPDSEPFVKQGDHVKAGQVLCIVEAMKLMNEIKAEVNGEIVEVVVANGDPLEFGQLLFLIKED